LVPDFEAEPRLSPRAEVQVIRVIQEALTNVRKHAAASATVVRVTSDDGFVTFRIEDDGRGFDPARRLLDRDPGFGLHSMRERMESIGGTLAVEAAPGRGTTVIAQVPALPGASQAASEVVDAHGRFEAVGRR
jgi:two-component system nitrate/nitrite sensor histidine kinase NarX